MKLLNIKNSWFFESDLRLDASYHLSDGPVTKIKLKKSPYEISKLSSETKDIFKGNIFKRTYVTNIKEGFPFMTASDMMKCDINGGKFVSRKYTNLANLMLKKDWILVSRSGTIGNTVYTNKDFENVVGTDDLIRIIPNNTNILGGFVYAYLSSKYGYGLLTQSGYGGVVQHIEPHHIEDLPIPVFPKGKQEEIHNLIIEVSLLREEANKLINEAKKEISEKINFDLEDFKQKSINSNTISLSHLKRFEAQYFKSEGSKMINHIEANFKYEFLKNVSEPLFRPGIFKRHYVKEGIEFLGGADIVKAIPSSEKKLSKSKTSHLDAMIIKENWILVTCGGTIGYSVLVDRMTAGKAASQHILRVIPKNLPSGYVYAFMSSNIGLKAIQSFTYGSVIPQIEPHHLELLPIPILEEEVMNRIHQKVMKYKENIGNAIEKELKAIDLIEKEIESWQKS